MGERKKQVEAVKELMTDGTWWTLSQLQSGLQLRFGLLTMLTGVSARVRDLRKAAYGGNTVQRRVVAGTRNVWQYRLA